MKRLSWSLLFSFGTLASLGLAQTRVDVDRNVIKARVPSSAGGFMKAWEGFTSTNYLSTEQYVFTPPMAQMAAGPTNIITIVNRRIAIYDNPNAIVPVSNTAPAGPTRIPQVLSPTSYLPTNEALIDSWLGEAVLSNLCPTGSFSNISCLVDNATVRYDQMHGRYIVGMTVTDTGVETLGNVVTRPRKASWVLLISRFSTFPQFGQAGSSDIFITPTPPSGATGGVNTTNWAIYYGNALDGLGSDGFGNVPDPNQTVGPGNINSIPGVFPSSASQGQYFGCGTGDAGDLQNFNPTGRACYFPTSLRIGIDNDNVILASAVVNVNFPIPPSPQAVPIPTFAGTRVRVLKKAGGSQGTAGGYYQKSLAAQGLVAGNQFAGTPAAASVGDYYDLYATSAAPMAPEESENNSEAERDVQLKGFNSISGAPLAQGNTNSTTLIPAPFTIAPPLGAQPAGTAAFCEPARVRGRAQASYTNSMVATSGVTSQNFLECVMSTQVIGGTVNRIWIQPIQYNPVTPINTPANTNTVVQFYPTLVGDGTTVGTANLTGMQFALVDPVADPSTVPQANYLGTTGGPSAGTAAPSFYVGDNRVHELVYREGHLYGARVGNATGTFQVVPGTPLSATVLYDVIQTLTANGSNVAGSSAAQRNPILLTKWNNTYAFAPMFDVPANVTTYGQAAPINLFPWLEKLFVATTYPQLHSSDTRVAQQVPGTDTPSTTIRSRCQASNVVPNVVAGVPDSTLGYPGLYDMHCGMDVFDAIQNFRNPVTGQLMTYIPRPGLPPDTSLRAITPMLRGGSSTDPNNGSLWAFGLYANRRFAGVGNNGQLGSYIANYDLAFPTTDPYGNTTAFFSDCNSVATCPFFVYIQIAAQQGIINRNAATVGVNQAVTRGEMAKLVILSMMDEPAITAYLQNTGGCTTSFADVASDCNGGVSGGTVGAGPAAGSNWRYIETMYRKRITTGCAANDARREFCPTRTLTRGEMAVFLIRAKMGNVYPTVISGCPTPQTPGCVGVTGGDNFGLTIPGTPYFSDVTTANPYFLYIQKMYELRITNGTNPVPGAPAFTPGTPGVDSITRGEILVFVVRSFFL